MMRFLGPALRRLFRLEEPMDMQVAPRATPDPIGAALGAAVDEHARVMNAEATLYQRRLRDMTDAIDDVFRRLEKTDAHG